MRLCLTILLSLTVLPASAQVLSNASLTGKYFLRHLQYSTDGNNNVTDIRSLLGSANFDGAGNYTFTGNQVIGNTPFVPFTTTGTYVVAAAGTVVVTNPQNKAVNMNGRLGNEALVASTTETTSNTFDFLIAIPAPTIAPNNSTPLATWTATDFEMTLGSTGQVRTSLATMSLDGTGNIPLLTLNGHAANYNLGRTLFQTVTGGTYSLNPDGTGAITFPTPAGVSGAGPLLNNASRTAYLSKSGNILLAGTPGGHDIFIAIRNSSASIVVNNGFRFWTAGLRVDSTGASDSYAGSASVAANDGAFLNTRRLHETASAPLNVTEAATYSIAPDGTGTLGAGNVALEQANLLVGATNGGALDPTGYEITFALPMPPVTGTGVFINPQGIFNAASNAPAGDALSPGEFISIFGSGFVSTTTVAPSEPFPTSLAGVTVSINGFAAPIYFVSATQIDCIVPYKVSGPTMNITVNSNGSTSNTVSVLYSNTSPAIFTQDGSGTSDGAITHANGSLVNSSSPAVKGETVVVYVSGLGALTTPVNDGYGATSFNNATTPLTVYVGGIPVPATAVLYQGLNVSAGLYQINFVVPTNLTFTGELPLALLTPDTFTDLVNIAIQ